MAGLRSLLSVLIFLLLPCMSWAQDDCHPHFTGSDKSDFEKGVEAYNNRRYQQCITLMRKVSNKNRTAADPYFYLGAASVKAGERPATIRSYFTKLFKYCPDYPNALAYYYLGVVHYSYKEYGDAVTQLNRYFEITNQQPNPAYDAVYEEASTYLYWSEFLSEAQQNQAPFFPTVVRGASSNSDEYLPYFSPDGKELYFLRSVPAHHKRSFYDQTMDEKVLRLFCSRWKDTAYTYGKMLPAPFNSGDDEGGITLTADGKTLYYSRVHTERGYSNCDIFCCRRKNGIWQNPQDVGHNINGDRTWESQPSVTADGQYLFFSSNRPGGLGGTDIWRCRRLPNGDWSRAENLGPAVNTPGDEKCPFIHADGKTLYFASNGWQGFGGYDMYFIDITDTYLQRPTNLGLPINSEDDDICFGVTTDGKRGYFAGKSLDWTGIGGTDIFTFELYPAAQPEEMAIVTSRPLKGIEGRPAQGSVSVLRQKAEADIYPVEGDGEITLALSVRGSNTVVVNVEGCLPMVFCGNAAQVRRDLNAASFQLLPAQLQGVYPLPLPTHGANRDILPLDNAATAVLDAYADYLLAHPKMHIRIEAPRMDQAKALYDYLLSRQLRAERFEYKPNSALSSPRIVITQM